jgi:hypothetical protein
MTKLFRYSVLMGAILWPLFLLGQPTSDDSTLNFKPGTQPPFVKGAGSQPSVIVAARYAAIDAADQKHTANTESYNVSYTIKTTVTNLQQHMVTEDGVNYSPVLDEDGNPYYYADLLWSVKAGNQPEVIIYFTTVHDILSKITGAVIYSVSWTGYNQIGAPDLSAYNGSLGQLTGPAAADAIALEKQRYAQRTSVPYYIPVAYLITLPQYSHYFNSPPRIDGAPEYTTSVIELPPTPAVEQVRDFASSSYWDYYSFVYGDPLTASLSTPSAKRQALQKMQYKFVLTPSTPPKIDWVEIFTPKNGGQQKSFIYQSLSFSADQAESEPFTIDPLGLDPNDLHASQRTGQDGTWEIAFIRLESLYETGNHANRIFNPTPKDDSTGNDNPNLEHADNDETYAAPRNKLYVAADPTDKKFRVSLRLNVPPSLRTKYKVAVWDGNTKIPESEVSLTADENEIINLVFPGPDDAAIKEYQVRFGNDENNNGLEAGEASPIPIYRRKDSAEIQYAVIKGISAAKYDANFTKIAGYASNSAIGTAIPHAQALLNRFVIGNFSGASASLAPNSLTQVAAWNPFQVATATNSNFSEWLTHNCGLKFAANDKAPIVLNTWNSGSDFSAWISSKVDPLALKYTQIITTPDGSTSVVDQPTSTATALQSFFQTVVAPIARNDLANKQDGDEFVSEWYKFPGTDNSSTLFSSLSPGERWPQSTLLLGREASEGGAGGGIEAVILQLGGDTSALANYDAFAAIARARVAIEYQFTVARIPKPSGDFDVIVTNLECRGTVRDLYDFNFEDGAPAADSLPQRAATIQIGSRVGSRTMPTLGNISLMQWNIDTNYPNPF